MLAFDDISVAPMEGFTTFPMRLFLRMTSNPRKMTTPFLKVTRAYPESEIPFDFAPELYELRDVFPYEIVPQFIAGEIDCFLRATELIPEFTAKVIELNCGCPSPNSMGKYAGSGILQDPDYFSRSLERIIAALGPERVALKMRVGIVHEDEFAELLDRIAPLTFARLTIHGRTKKAGYRGTANWSLVDEAARRFEHRLPVLGSGDVVSSASFESFRAAASSAKGLMIGRGVLKNPWIFEEIRGGKRVEVEAGVFILALYSYLLIQDLWHTEPHKLMARIAKGRIGSYCGFEAKAWEREAVELSSLALGLPLLPFGNTEIKVSPVAFDRLKILWTHLRGSLPDDLRLSAINKAENPRAFFAALGEALVDYSQILPIEIIN